MKDKFYYVDDVTKILGVSKSQAYKIIRDLRKAQAIEKGIPKSCIPAGRISIGYFKEKFVL